MNEPRRSSENETTLLDRPSNESIAAGVGALLGALFGAALGSALAGAVGGLIGAIVGAIIGGSIGKMTVRRGNNIENGVENQAGIESQTVGTHPSATVIGGESRGGTDVSLVRRSQDTGTSTSSQPAWNRVERSDSVKVPLVEERLQVDKRELEAGRIRLRKVVKTEVVHVPVELRREEVIVERVEPGAASTSSTEANATSQPVEYADKDEIVIPLVKEEPVVEKKAVVFSEVHVNRVTRTETKTVQETVRREDVIVDRKEK